MAGKKGMHDKHRFSEEYMNKLRGKIQANKLLEVLHDHAIKGVEMQPSRINAALGLLRKVLPELNSTEMKATVVSYLDALKQLQVGAVSQDPQEEQRNIH